MKKVDVTQVKVISALSASDYEERFNAALRELAIYSPTFKQDDTNPFLCFVYYTLPGEPIPETLHDEFTLAGRKMQCADCPYFFMNEDKRMKARCLLHRCIIEPNKECCEEYLEEVKAAEGGVINHVA